MTDKLLYLCSTYIKNERFCSFARSANMVEIKLKIYSVSEKLPELRKLVYAKYAAAEGNWFPVRLMEDKSLPLAYYWQDLTEPENDDEVSFERFTHWLELPTKL